MSAYRVDSLRYMLEKNTYCVFIPVRIIALLVDS